MMAQQQSRIPPRDVDRIVQLCNQLEVGWCVSPSEIDITRFESGYVSTIYRVTFCTAPPPTAPLPASVVIKFYLDKDESEIGYARLTSQLNNLIIGQCEAPRLGPAVLLVTPNALVLEYVHSRATTEEDDADLEFRQRLAATLAHFHALNVPIPRNDHQSKVTHIFNEWLDSRLLASVYSGTVHRQLVGGAHLPSHLLAHDLRAEADYVRDAVLRSHSPLVLSHRDFNRANILLELSGPRQGQIRLIDFDYTSYFYRGTELGRYLANCTHSELFHDADLISDAEMRHFVSAYRAECIAIHGAAFAAERANSVEAILAEAKLFVLYAYWIDIIFAIAMATDSEEVDKQQQFSMYADKRFHGYLKVKARFQADGSIPK